jgi:hypothetical protein
MRPGAASSGRAATPARSREPITAVRTVASILQLTPPSSSTAGLRPARPWTSRADGSSRRPNRPPERQACRAG